MRTPTEYSARRWDGDREVVFVDDGLGEDYEDELDQWERRRDS